MASSKPIQVNKKAMWVEATKKRKKVKGHKVNDVLRLHS